MERHKPSALGVGRKLDPRDPHAGPTPGDASFRNYFVTPEAYLAAMNLAAKLEAKGMHRRAWRVRLNLDGPQPVYAPSGKAKDLDDEIEVLPPPKLKIAALGHRDPAIPKMIYALKREGVSQRGLAEMLGVSHHLITRWIKGQCVPDAEMRSRLELLVLEKLGGEE